MADADLARISTTKLPLALLPGVSPTSPDQNPTAVCLASLDKGSRRPMRVVIMVIGGLLSTPTCRAVRYLTAPSARLGRQHTTTIRAQLHAHCAPAPAHKLLAALGPVEAEGVRAR
jgi:hypothetical protein